MNEKLSWILHGLSQCKSSPFVSPGEKGTLKTEKVCFNYVTNKNEDLVPRTGIGEPGFLSIARYGWFVVIFLAQFWLQKRVK